MHVIQVAFLLNKIFLTLTSKHLISLSPPFCVVFQYDTTTVWRAKRVTKHVGTYQSSLYWYQSLVESTWIDGLSVWVARNVECLTQPYGRSKIINGDHQINQIVREIKMSASTDQSYLQILPEYTNILAPL